MAIFRGTGGSGDSTQDSSLNEVTQQAVNAASSASAATLAASTSTTKASEAAASAATATTKATTATTQASTATAKAGEASISAAASAADLLLTNADVVSAEAAKVSAQAAEAITLSAEADAQTFASNAAASGAAAIQYANLANAQALSATASASTATTQASNAASSASSASGSASTATTQASTATTQASTATTKASEAAASATAANISKLAAASSANDINVAAIDASISDTAVDVFIYDTSKDSDGGAWRKRTQATSWYNETLNTSTRGSRKEFPSVAVIVAEGGKVKIYDGDDPSMPMWMVFEGGGSSFSNHTMLGQNNNVEAVAIRNGVMGAVKNGGQALVLIDFLKETSEILRQSNDDGMRGFHTTKELAKRNIQSGEHHGTLRQLCNNNGNDIAMTVLPNAPIDSATGLPIPTIAVATDGGVSVIKDDGSVVDITNTSGDAYEKTKLISFTEDNRLRFVMDSTAWRFYRTHNIPTTDTSISNWSNVGHGIQLNSTGDYSGFAYIPNSTSGTQQATKDAIGTNKGVITFIENTSNYANSSVAYITSDYSTGYMVGDIKLAALSDTDDTDVVGSELVTNGDITSGYTGWSQGNPSSLSISGGALVVTGVGTGYPSAQQLITVEVGKTYTVSGQISRSGNYSARVESNQPAWLNHFSTSSSTMVNFSSTFTAITTSLDLRFTIMGTAVSSSHSLSIDNISVRLADSDRSVNGNGLAVHGTITKDPVATGADLVAYSFGATGGTAIVTNALIDPAFVAPTGDMSFMFWATSRVSDSELFTIGATNTSTPANGIHVWANANQLKCHWASTGIYSGTSDLTTASQFICVLRRGSVLELYIDGTLRNSLTNSTAITETGLTIGNGYYGGGGDDMALFRISATAPTAAQIKTIYEAEKPLFQENAQATLYGTSDAVTALAHDSDTNLLHVGTSSGRSVFQGLRRVDNTTTAVGAAISASNGLIVED
jgi:hypothetical protein